MIIKLFLVQVSLICYSNANQTVDEEIVPSDYSRIRTERLYWIPWRYNDPPPENQESFDFIIVGSGSAGATLANRLSEKSEWRVLLLEVGTVATTFTEVPILAPFFQNSQLDWTYHAERENGSCWGCPNGQMGWPRGRGLGGSTLINFMIHVRGNSWDYDRWEALGNPQWSYKDVLPYFKKLEDATLEFQDNGYHGKGGYMTVSDVPYRSEGAQAFIKAAQQAGYPYVDYNGANQMGVSFVQGNIRNGIRCSMEKAYLRPIRNRKNLKILIQSRVTKVLIDPKTKQAYGVEFVRKQKHYQVRASKEVILSAGTFNSPQLLMLSGIGPSRHLKELGIPIIKKLPVGKKMFDHLTFLGLNFLVNESIILTIDGLSNTSHFVDLLYNGKGPLTVLGGVEALMYMKTNASSYKENYPDVEAIFLGSNVAIDKGVIVKNTMSISSQLYDEYWKGIEERPFFQVLPMLLHPKSFGYLKLKSKNPFNWPKFYPQYFTDRNNEDIKTFIASIREIIRVMEMPVFKKYNTTLYDKPIPGCGKHEFNSDVYWECALRTLAPTLHHQISTCKMGPREDREAVVDHRLKVHGIKNLRVVDTSIIPVTLSAHTSIPTIMIGEKAADMIKEDWILFESSSNK